MVRTWVWHSSTFPDILSLSLDCGFQYPPAVWRELLALGNVSTAHCVSLVPRETLQIRIWFVRQRSFLPLKQSNKTIFEFHSVNLLFSFKNYVFFSKLQCCADPNVHFVHCTNRNSSPQNSYDFGLGQWSCIPKLRSRSFRSVCKVLLMVTMFRLRPSLWLPKCAGFYAFHTMWSN